MTMSGIKHILLITSFAILSSCAYMQTNKNVRENSRTHTGYQITSTLSLHKAGGTYYLEAEQQQLRKHYPAIYDSAFLKQHNKPWFEQAGGESLSSYHPISNSTAEILQRKDGYIELSTLKAELEENPDSWTTTLPAGSRSCIVKAEVKGESETWAGNEQPVPVSSPALILGAADFVCVDIPGTILYNAAIPFMAPIIFFYEFLTEE